MAHRIAPLSTPIRSSPAYRRRLATLADRERVRFMENPRLYLWQVGWSPIWLGSNGPAPRPGQRRQMPQRAAQPGNNTSGAGDFVRSHLDRLAFRLWLSLLVGSILRGLWLALLLMTGWVLLATIGLAGLPPATAIVAAAGIGAVVGGVYGWLHPIDPTVVAMMLDRTFGLDERLTTATGRTVEGPASASAVPFLPRLQLADAANSLGEVVHELPRSVFFPVREAIALLVVAMALLTGLFGYVPDQPVPSLADAPVPRFVPASERLANPGAAERPLATTPEQPAPSAADIQQQAQAAQQAREDLAVLGEALKDHPITQPASDAIAAGDYGAASESIRAAASQAPSASQEERTALADDLDTAANQVAPTNPDLADASRKAADDLREGGTQSEEGLEGLADTVDKTAGAVAPNDETAQETGSPSQESQPGEQGAPGGAQPGTTGQEEAGGNPQQGQDSGTDQGSSSQSEQPAGDPGKGVAAAPGVANEAMQEQEAGGAEPGEMSGAASAGQSQSGAGGAPDPEASGGGSASDQAGQQPAGGEGASTGGDPASDPGSQGLVGAPEDETSASQGSGAGTGQTGANDQTSGDQKVGDPAAPGGGEAADPPVVGEVGDPPPGDGGGEGSAGEIGNGSGGTNNLPLQGTSDSGVRTGGTSGSSSSGSGAGSGAASGDQVRQQVGVAGPDANRIPEGMQDIIEDFFTEPGTGP